jgi:hypothetical protein
VNPRDNSSVVLRFAVFGTGPDEGSPNDRLESWKEIAAYLGRGVTTVQRWENDKGLPIHRLPHAKKGSVFAFTRELDAWRVARAQLGTARSAGDAELPVTIKPADSRLEPPLGFRRNFVLTAVGAVGILLVALAIGMAVHRAMTRPSVVASAVPFTPRPIANDAAIEQAPSLRVQFGFAVARDALGLVDPVRQDRQRRDAR